MAHFITTAYELLPAFANLPISRWPVTQTTRTRACAEVASPVQCLLKLHGHRYKRRLRRRIWLCKSDPRPQPRV